MVWISIAMIRKLLPVCGTPKSSPAGVPVTSPRTITRSPRFAGAPDAAVFEWGKSLSVDYRLIDDDITGSQAWAEALGKAAQKLGEVMYAESQAKSQGAASGAGSSGEKKQDEKVVDAEYTEVDDKK